MNIDITHKYPNIHELPITNVPLLSSTYTSILLSSRDNNNHHTNQTSNNNKNISKNKYLGQIHNTKLDTILPNPSLVTSVDNYSISISNDHSPNYHRSHHTNVNNINILPSPK